MDQEFRKFVHNTESHLWSLFQNIDRDHDGKLDKSELSAAFTRAGLAVPDNKLNRFFKDVDRNNDGAISFNEWRYGSHIRGLHDFNTNALR